MSTDISAYGDTGIVISGLQEEDFTVTPYELAAFVLGVANGENPP